jgi:hypothetical protein
VTVVYEHSSANPMWNRLEMLEVGIFGPPPLKERCTALGDMRTTEIGDFRSYTSRCLLSKAGRMDLKLSIVWIERVHQGLTELSENPYRPLEE